MRIESLTLERYGHFTDRRLAFRPDAALHVVVGANEAGKTSALSAIGDLLFGFGARTDYDFRHESKTLRLGGTFRHGDGRQLAVRRRKGTKNTLLDQADQPLPDDCLEPYLAGVTRDVFSREFGLTAQALRVGGNELLNAGGSLAATLAASSAGLTILSRVRDRLKGEADDLFTPRKSASKLFYVAADRHDAAEKALRDAIVTRDALGDVEKAVAEAGARLDALNADHAASGRDLARWQRTLRVRSRLARLQQLEQELAGLADLPPLPLSMLDQWRGALAADSELSRELNALDAADAADAESIATMSIDDGILSAGPAIDALRERLGAVRKAMEDLPRRREARRLAQEQLDAAARRLGLPSYIELLARLPTDPALAHVRDLIDRARRAEQSRREADDKRARVQQELDALTVDDGASRAMTDPEAARQRLDALADIPTQADRLRREASALTIEKNNIAAAGAALDPSPGDVTRLSARPLPDHAVIAAHARAAELTDAEVRRLNDVLATAEAAIETAEAELARLSDAGAVSTRADLFGARAARNARLEGLRGVLDGDRSERAARFADVETSSRAVDDITDRLLTDADRAARREATQERLDQSRRERDRIVSALSGLQGRRADADKAWQSIWTSSGLAPRSPAEMLGWCERVRDLAARMARLDAQQADLDALAASQSAGKDAIIALLDDMGRAPDRTVPAEILFREARSRLDELQKAWSDARTRAVARRHAERDLAEAQTALDALAQAGAELAQVWPAAMMQIGQAERASVAEAEAALAVWQSVAVPKLNLETEGHRVDSIEADLVAFDGDVAAVLQAAPGLKGNSAQETLARLAERLAEMRRAADACHRLREAIAKRGSGRKAMSAKRAALDVALHEACHALGAADTAALGAAIERVTTRLALENEQSQLRRDLLEVADGRDEDELRAEQQGLDVDALPGEIARETIRQKQLQDEIAETYAQHSQRQREYQTLTWGRDAAAAAAERAEAGAELVSIAERWLLRSAAARLATLAIEKHRAMVQDPLIARASDLFALATGGAFAGLGIDYGDDDQPALVALRSSGERVAITGLSEGSRDQLFLALRLGLLERRTNQPLPFIGDDLLTSFDEARTAATLDLLAAAGHARQMIVFTHHRHVGDLAAAMPHHAVEVIEL